VRIDWQRRAAQAETAVLGRHLRRLVAVPGTRLGVVSRPAGLRDRLAIRWNFWWQAHLLDCLVDGWLRRPDPARARLIATLIRSIKLRNLGWFTNDYYDDMAWMGLALQRAEAAGAGDWRGISQIVTRILDAWSPPVGGIPWRVGDDYFNAPANGPAAILLARTGFHDRAERTADWMDSRLRLPGSELIADGFYPGEEPRPVYYTYVQGVVLGAEVELAGTGRSRVRVHRLVAAVESSLADNGVLRGNGGGDGGLFAGILARYLATVAMALPGDDPADRDARATAARLVLASAEAAWLQSAKSAHGPLFGPEWAEPAVLPARGDQRPERDLSVQLSGWMLMEAAAALERSSAGRPGLI
jgi:predicted alpha-1,6-mannanase (GH76 family)